MSTAPARARCGRLKDCVSTVKPRARFLPLGSPVSTEPRGGGLAMTRSWLSFVARLVLASVVVAALLVAPAAAKKPPRPKPPPPPPPAPAANFDTYIRNYAPVIDGAKCDVTPQAVVTTSDGGSAALSLSSQPSSAASESCAGVGWLVKFDSFGNPQWQELVGCFHLPGGRYSYGVSLQQTADGGYLIGGGTIGCGSDTVCPLLGGTQCGLVERLDATGRLLWARVYSSGAARTSINQIRQTSDGGFVAVGSEVNSSANTGAVNALVLKLDSQGNVEWRSTPPPPGEGPFPHPNAPPAG